MKKAKFVTVCTLMALKVLSIENHVNAITHIETLIVRLENEC